MTDTKHLSVVLLLLILASLGLRVDALAQDSLSRQEHPFRTHDLSTKIKVSYPFYVFKVDGKTCVLRGGSSFIARRRMRRVMRKIDFASIDSFELLKDKKATEKYGDRGKYGVIIFNFKSGIKLPGRIRRCSK